MNRNFQPKLLVYTNPNPAERKKGWSSSGLWFSSGPQPQVDVLYWLWTVSDGDRFFFMCLCVTLTLIIIFNLIIIIIIQTKLNDSYKPTTKRTPHSTTSGLRSTRRGFSLNKTYDKQCALWISHSRTFTKTHCVSLQTPAFVFWSPVTHSVAVQMQRCMTPELENNDALSDCQII